MERGWGDGGGSKPVPPPLRADCVRDTGSPPTNTDCLPSVNSKSIGHFISFWTFYSDMCFVEKKRISRCNYKGEIFFLI